MLKNVLTRGIIMKGRSLVNIVEELEKLAPITLAEKWDNVGLLIEPPKKTHIQRILLTNDLTEPVMNEAIQNKTDLIISYHPPIFAPLKRITQKSWKERVVALCLSESIALYSPHTAWDVMPGGINDWLCSALPVRDIEAIEPNLSLPKPGGTGRLFKTSLKLEEAIQSVQRHIGLNVSVSWGVDHLPDTVIETVAVCAGSGATVLKNAQADLYITGEMSHHDLLDAKHQNTTVILCNHSNSERGFFKKFQLQLSDILNHIENDGDGDSSCIVQLAQTDRDPIEPSPYPV